MFDVLTNPFDQAWIEASTKGAVLIFAASEIEERTVGAGVSPAVAGLLGGMGGGIAQAYATMGECLQRRPGSQRRESHHFFYNLAPFVGCNLTPIKPSFRTDIFGFQWYT
jgi:hypothetical protein